MLWYVNAPLEDVVVCGARQRPAAGRVGQREVVEQRLTALIDSFRGNYIAWKLPASRGIQYNDELPGVIDCLREVALSFKRRRHSHKDGVRRSDRMGLLERKEKE